MNVKLKHTVSKSAFKSKAFQYLREVEKTRNPLIITDHGKPVLKVVQFSEDPAAILRELRGLVIEYVDPTEPVGESDWESSG